MDSIENSFLLEQINLLDNILAASTDHTYIVDQAGRYLYASPAGLAALGLQADDLLGKTWRELNFPADVMERHDTHRKSVFQTGTPVKEETSYPTINGTRYYEYVISPIFGKDGEIEAVLNTSRDITERKQTENTLRQVQQALQESESRFAALIDAIFEGIIIQENGKIIDANPGFANLCGYSLEEVIGKSLGDFLTPESLELVMQHTESQYEQPYELIGIKQDGTFINLEVVGKQSLYQGRSVRVAAIRDITERKQAEAELRERERLFSTLAETLPVAVFRFDADSNCTYINNYWTDMTGRSVESVMGSGWVESLHPEDRDRLVSTWLEWTQNAQQRGYYRNEGRFVHVNGQDVWYYIQALPEVNDSGETVGYIGVLTDITDRKQAEAKLRERDALLQLFAQYAPAGIAMFDREMRYVIASQRWVDDYYQSSLESLIGRSHYEVFPEISEQWRQIHQRCLAGAIEKCDEDLFVRADGSQQWIHWEVRPWYRATGEIGGIIMFAEDVTQRKQAESSVLQLNQELQQRVTELQTLLDVIPIGIGIANDPDCQDIRVNPAFAQVLNIPTTVNASLSAPEEERPTTFKVYQNGREMAPEELPLQYAAIHGVEVQDLEVDVVWQDGTTVTLLEYAAPLLDEHGQRRGSVGAFLDISDRKRAEAALRESEERYRILVQNFPAGAVMLFDHDLHYVLAEGQGLAEVGLDRTLLEGKTIWEALDPETCRLIEPHYREALAGNPHVAEMPFANRIYRVNFLPLCDDQGAVKLGMVMTQDITLQKQVEQVLRASRDDLDRQVQERTRELQQANELLKQREQEFRTLVENTPDVITRHDRQHRCIYINPASTQSLGAPPEFFLGKKPSELGYPEDISLFWKNSLESVFATGEMRIDEFTVMNGDQPKSYQVYVVPEREAGSTIASVMTIGRDITFLRQAEASARKLAEELQRSNQELEQFAYIASHDLQEPLRAVTSFTQMLAKRYRTQLDAKADTYIEFIVDGATRMQHLIRDLLAYSRTGRYELKLQAVDFNALLERVKKDLQVAIAETQAVITADPLPTVFVDSNQFSNLLQNLISNSLKYRSDSSPQIHISARKNSLQPTTDNLAASLSSSATEVHEEWIFSIQDNGIGIDPQYAERIFGIFQRLHTSDEYSGTGLGLAICRKIIERHNGRIWVESHLGQGATFFFTIPISRSQDDIPHQATQDSPG